MAKDVVYSRYKRNYFYAFKSLVMWMSNPVSEDGPKYIFRLIYSALGSQVHNIAERMEGKPECQQLLEEKPNLGQVLADMERLRTMPQGSLGRKYYDFMNGDDVIPGYIIGGMVYRDGHFDKLSDWSDTAKFMLERAGNTHDITHMISGYGTDLAGEVLNIPFSVGGSGVSRRKSKALGAVIAILFWPVILPTIGIRQWVKVCIDSGERGAIMAEKNNVIEIPFEAMLEMPLLVAREKLNIPAHKYSQYSNDEGWVGSKNWMRSWLGKRIERGHGKLDATMVGTNAIKELVEGGLTIRTVMSSDKAGIRNAHHLFRQGQGAEVLREALAL